MWDAGWDDVPPGAPASAHSPARSPATRPGRDPASRPTDGWPDDSDGPRPGRWYAPSTSRGKLILLLTVAAVLVLTLVACCVGIAGLARLRSVDPFGLL